MTGLTIFYFHLQQPKTQSNTIFTKLFDSQNHPSGFKFYTDEINPKILGYGGKFRILVTLDSDLKITEAQLIEHHETAAYINERIEKFLYQFIGKSGEHFKIGQNIDAMTRATISSKAFTSSIEQGIEKIRQIISDRHYFSKKNTKKIVPVTNYFDQIIPFLLFMLAILAMLNANQILRWITLLTSLIYLGIIKSSMLSIITLGNISLGQTPDYNLNPIWYILMTLNLLTLILFKNVYCASICPFLAVQDIANTIRQKLHFSSIPMNNKLRITKYFVLGIALLLFIIYRNTDAIIFEPYVLLFSGNPSVYGLILLIILIATSFFIYRFWCKFFCPWGALQKLIYKLNLFTVPAPKSTIEEKNDSKKIFLTLYIITIVFIILTIAFNITNLKKSTISAHSPGTNVLMTEKNESDKIKKELEAKGIRPVSAKYWEKL
ncbi:MAG: 4Fe-4S binding protein [Candidatus Omnitrophica bacterium]|nr:4Fe-4S binding protein [Candidatus Omnitrophota bacterium]